METLDYEKETMDDHENSYLRLETLNSFFSHSSAKANFECSNAVLSVKFSCSPALAPK